MKRTIGSMTLRIQTTSRITTPTPIEIDPSTLAWENEVYDVSPIGGDACRY